MWKRSEAYLELSKTNKMEHFAKIVNGWKSLNIFVKGSILDVWLGLNRPLKMQYRCSCDTAAVSVHYFILVGFIYTLYKYTYKNESYQQSYKCSSKNSN